eukprot:scaffold37964_cov205-Skeletonema_marinoi.AAC.5
MLAAAPSWENGADHARTNATHVTDLSHTWSLKDSDFENADGKAGRSPPMTHTYENTSCI